MGKKLFILEDYCDLNYADSLMLNRCDRLAISPGAMLAFEEKKLSYLTFQDLYDYRQFRANHLKLITAAENLFTALDYKFQASIDFPRAFRGNIYWFLIFFANIHYISTVSEKINQIYTTIYFGETYSTLPALKIDMNFFFDNLNFSFGYGSRNNISMLRSYFISKHKYTGLKLFLYKKPKIRINRYKVIYLMKNLFKRASGSARSLYIQLTYPKKGKFFIIQDGFEVALLKEYLPEILFVNPVKIMQGSHAVVEQPNKGISLKEDIDKFTEQWFPGYVNIIYDIFNKYNQEIISRLNIYLKKIELLFKFHKPLALLYSAGAHRIDEDVFAYVANANNLPVIYFQHGGTNFFWKHSYLRFTEYNQNIKRINILHSRVSDSNFQENAVGENEVLGSIRMHHLYQAYRKNSISKKNRSILYCVGPFPCSQYKHLMDRPSDKVLFGTNSEIVETTARFNLRLDIKPYPGEEDGDYAYFYRLLKIMRVSNVGLLKGFPAEQILKSYGLLILDDLVSALLPIAILINTPVILYFKDPSVIRNEAFLEIKKRFYLAQNISELKGYLSQFASGELDSKFSSGFVDRYSFPLKNGNPAINIANYIRQKIKS